MNITKIEELLKENKFEEVLQTLTIELNKSFDFSDSEAADSFVNLKDYFIKADQGLLHKLKNFDFTNGNTRSPKMDSVTVNITDVKEISKYFIEAIKKIKIDKCSYHLLPKSDAKIVIILSDVLDDLMKHQFGINDDIFSNCEVGNYISTINGRNEINYLLNGSITNGYANSLLILEGFSKIVKSIFEQSLNEINIIFILSNDKKLFELQKIFMGYTIWQLLYLIAVFSTRCSLPEFVFLFNSDNFKKTFERTLLRLSIPEATNISSSYSSDIINLLSQRALTQDENYIRQLEAVAKIIDEEDIPLLITGESGVGKSKLAQIIHDSSARANANFEEINCGRLSAPKIEQDLFGWIKGAFTDAKFNKKGKVALADNGTLFLDEIDRTDSAVRNSLLTFLENKVYNVLGEEENRIGDVRLVFGTNKDLKKMISKGIFEEDFYYRISERIIAIPPLRNRTNDIEIIADYVLKQLNEKKDCRITIDKDALKLLKNYSWPGNTRELVRYLRLRFYDCIAKEQSEINAKMIEDAPFDYITVSNEEDLEELIESIKKFLSSWDVSHGDFLHRLIAPITAKLFIDDSFPQMNRSEKFQNAIKIIGINGNAFRKSDLQSYYDDFNKIRTILGLD